MNITQIPNRIELSLWQTAIDLMDTSPFVRRLCTSFYAFFRRLTGSQPA